MATKDLQEEIGHEDSNAQFTSIELLQDAGVNAADINKLKDAGYATVGQLFQVAHKTLLQVKGISDAKLDKILQACSKVRPNARGFVTANEISQKMHQKYFITTGAKQLDEILGGGMETMTMTEIHGEYRTGKTQLCHTLCVTCQLPRSQGGGAGKVAYVDTEGTFRPERIREIAESRFNLNPHDVLENIIVARAFNHDDQMSLVDQLGLLFADPEKGPFRLLIIDSVTAMFRTDFRGRGELSERQQRLNGHLMRLVKHAEEFNIAVVLVNQVMADPGAVSMFGPVIRPIGGHVLSHAVHSRIFLKKGRDNSRICRLTDSPSMPEREAMIQIAVGGISDVTD